MKAIPSPFLLPVLIAGAALLAIPPAGGAQAPGSRVSIDPTGALVIDGKKVFPIGFTMPPPPDGKTPAGKDAIAELRATGATFHRTGVQGQAWNDAAIRQEERYQEAAARNGMRCWVNLRELASIG